MPMLAAPRTSQRAFRIGPVEDGVIKPVVDKKYPLDDALEALAYVASGRAAGKVVVEA